MAILASGWKTGRQMIRVAGAVIILLMAGIAIGWRPGKPICMTRAALQSQMGSAQWKLGLIMIE